MEGVRKKLNAVVTVITVLSVLLVLYLSIQVIMGRNASLFGYRAYTIVTGSMEPTISVGQTVLVKEVDPETLEVGDIITFTSRDAAIYGSANTHRIYSITEDSDGNKCFITKGDANSSEDGLYVYPSEIHGKVVFYVGSSLNTFLGFLHTKLGFFLVIVCPLMIVIWWFMRDLKKQMNEYTQAAAEQRLEEENEAKDEPKEETIEEVAEEVSEEISEEVIEEVTEESKEEVKAEVKEEAVIEEIKEENVGE